MYKFCLLIFGIATSMVLEAKPLKVFQISQGFNDTQTAAPAVGIDNFDYFGFDFHNGKLVAAWMDNSVTLVLPCPSIPLVTVPSFSNIVSASVHVNSPWNVKVGPSIIVSPNNFQQGDPSIAINRSNKHLMTVASDNIILPPFSPTFVNNLGGLVASTTNGGQNWTTNFSLQKNFFFKNSKMPLPSGWSGISNNRLKYDHFGNLFLSYISCFNPDETTLNTTQFASCGFLALSTDHGKSFKVVEKLDPQTSVPNAEGYFFNELAVGKDQVAVSFTFRGITPPPRVTFIDNTHGHLYIFPIEGKGKVGSPKFIFLPYVEIVPKGGGIDDGFPISFGNGYGSMAFNPKGDLLIAESSFVINTHQSCGSISTRLVPRDATAGGPAQINTIPLQPFSTVNVGRALYPSQPTRPTWTQPQIAYVLEGHNKGRVYMAYLDNPNITPGDCDNLNSDTNVFVVFSDNDGATWSVPFPIPKINANTRIMPQIAIDKTTGNIGVGWLDAVNDPENIKVQVFATVIPPDFFDQ